MDISNIDTMILAGGLGTRLQSVLNDKPKCLAPINGRPFIDLLLDNCIKQGLKRFIICVGYLKEQVIKHLEDRSDCEIIFSKEDKPLGTGGALKNAESFLKSDPVLIMNGDSLIDADLHDFLYWHAKMKNEATIMVTEVENPSCYGSLNIDDTGLVQSFDEKKNSKTPGIINAGIYLFNISLLDLIPAQGTFSIEFQFFPKLINNKLYAYLCLGELIDIGTPESYAKMIKKT